MAQQRKNKNAPIEMSEEDQELFIELLPIIEDQIKRRRKRWTLKLGYMDYQDVSQKLLIHIYSKWDKYDKSQALEPWINRIITRQLQNIHRDEFGNCEQPCKKCPLNEGGDLCGHTSNGKKSSECKLYARWLKTKEPAYKIKTSFQYQDFIHESRMDHNDSIDIKVDKVHEHMCNILEGIENKIYKLIYVENKSDEEVRKSLGYSNSATSKRYIKHKCSIILSKTKIELKNDKIDI